MPEARGEETKARRRNRREALKLGAAAAAGAVVASVAAPRRSEAAAGFGGINNTGSSGTLVIASVVPSAAPGATFAAVNDSTVDDTVGLWGHGRTGGLLGTGVDGAGLAGVSLGGSHAGVEGFSGVPAHPAPAGVGVYGEGDQVGVYAQSEDGWALRVEGLARFSTAGRDTVPAGLTSKTVSVPGMEDTSVVLVTLNNFPGAGNYLERAYVADDQFTVHLAAAAPRNISFSYLVLN